MARSGSGEPSLSLRGPDGRRVAHTPAKEAVLLSSGSVPPATLAQALDLSASHMKRVLHMPEADAKVKANEMIPKLKRWMKE